MSHHDCSGCGLCLLVCPVWHGTRDVRLTPKGRARAIQHGAKREDLAASTAGCTLCGACEPACPEELPLVDMVMELRSGSPFPEAEVRIQGKKKLLLAGRALRAEPDRLARTLALLEGYELAADDGADIVEALEAGTTIADERLAAFLASLALARQVVVAEGLLLRALRRWLADASVRGIGETLLPAISAKLRAGDFYVIASQAFNCDQPRLIGRYDWLRATSGCEMNLDLQRIAMPVAGQARWILEGRRVERIVVEDLAERAAFDFAGKPVLHLAELA
ncbi:MAG: (Fe-S)-binding protein [Betaproteobacteria bacterium]|nr:(Fe-S)-binding protein [Betaproteobacteria bacterium]MBV9361821.1 (Fe-S)-binding protein [Betaproteobacteria bacterium]